MSKKGHVPVRMCAICRERFPKETLIRYVNTDTGLTEDNKKHIFGRGIYICSSSSCINKAKKRWTII